MSELKNIGSKVDDISKYDKDTQAKIQKARVKAANTQGTQLKKDAIAQGLINKAITGKAVHSERREDLSTLDKVLYDKKYNPKNK